MGPPFDAASGKDWVVNIISSLHGALSTARADAALVRHGSWPGWYTFNHYRGRLQCRDGRAGTAVEANLKVGSKRVRVFATTQHLGTLHALFVDREYDLLALMPDLRPSTVLDLGANTGMASAYLNALYPGAEFICVEPDPRNLPLLRRTLAMNGLRSTIEEAAIADRSGELRLRFGSNPSCSALETSPMHELEESVLVRVTTVPEILAKCGWDRIDLLKVDIEGSEVDLLGHNNSWLEQVGAVVLEIHPNTGPDEIGGYLEPYGFRLRRTCFGTEPVYVAERGGTS